jgi:hypothetical protein
MRAQKTMKFSVPPSAHSRARDLSDTLEIIRPVRARVRALLFESSAFEVVKSEPPPSVLDGGFDGLKLFSCPRGSMREAAVYRLSRRRVKDR